MPGRERLVKGNSTRKISLCFIAFYLPGNFSNMHRRLLLRIFHITSVLVLLYDLGDCIKSKWVFLMLPSANATVLTMARSRINSHVQFVAFHMLFRVMYNKSLLLGGLHILSNLLLSQLATVTSCYRFSGYKLPYKSGTATSQPFTLLNSQVVVTTRGCHCPGDCLIWQI